jgi:hypothetical protein
VAVGKRLWHLGKGGGGDESDDYNKGESHDRYEKYLGDKNTELEEEAIMKNKEGEREGPRLLTSIPCWIDGTII